MTRCLRSASMGGLVPEVLRLQPLSRAYHFELTRQFGQLDISADDFVPGQGRHAPLARCSASPIRTLSKAACCVASGRRRVCRPPALRRRRRDRAELPAGNDANSRRHT
jgi:hypothetical protein